MLMLKKRINELKLKMSNILIYILCFNLSFFSSSLSAYAQDDPQIIADGRTNTSVLVKGNVTNITTTSIYGKNGINSFDKFDVYKGNIVNLHVPDNAKNLINLIHNQKTSINGILNSYKNGEIGGNVFFLNSNGIIVGKSGQMNLGSAHFITPTAEYMRGFISNSGIVNPEFMNQLLDGAIPISSTGLILIEGSVNAKKSIFLQANGLNISGALTLSEIETRQLVNLDGLEEANTVRKNNDGSISLLSDGNINISGEILAEGSDKINGKNISIKAKNDIHVENNALISVKGVGKDSNAGEINIYAIDVANFEQGAKIDIRGGEISGDGGFVEFSAKNTVNLKGGIFYADSPNGLDGFVLIDPADITISSNQLMSGGNYDFLATESFTLMDNIIISTRNISGSDQESSNSTGDSGNISITAPIINLGTGSKLLAHSTGSYSAGDITLTASSTGTSSILLDGSTIKGKNITFNSLASTENVLYSSNPLHSVNSTIDLKDGTVITASNNVSISSDSIQDKPLFNNGLFDARNSESYILLNSTTITAEGSISLISKSNLETQLSLDLSAFNIPVDLSVASTDSIAHTILNGDSSITALGSVSILSQAKTESTVTAFANSSIPLSATIAISDIKNEAQSIIQGNTTIQSSDIVSITAEGVALTDTNADSSTSSMSGASFAVAINVLDSDTIATISEGASVSGSTGLNIHANSINTAKNGARASVMEGNNTSVQDQLSNALTDNSVDSSVVSGITSLFDSVLSITENELLDSEESGGGTVQLAGALSVNVVNTNTEASIKGNVDKNIISSGPIDLKTKEITQAFNLASGRSGAAAVGGGAGVSVQISDHSNRAFIEGDAGTTLNISSGDGISISALTESYDSTISDEDSNDFSSIAYSGQGGTTVGLAGALSLNLVRENKVESLLGENTNSNLGNGDLEIQASNTTVTNSIANGNLDEEESTIVDDIFSVYSDFLEIVSPPEEEGAEESSGTSIGIGASIALDISKNETFSTLNGNAIVSNLDQINISSISFSSHEVEAKSAASGGISIVPIIALNVSEDITRAEISTSSNSIDATGDVSVSGTQEISSITIGSGEAGDADEASVVAIGLSVGLNISYSTVEAIIDRDISTQGDLAIMSSSKRSISTAAMASVNGAGGDDSTSEEEEDSSVIDSILSLVELANSLLPSGSSTDSQDTADQASVDSGEGGQDAQLSVAAALALNVTNSKTTSIIKENRNIEASDITIFAEDNTDSKTIADGQTAGAAVNLGAAVSLNIVDIDIVAEIAAGSEVRGDGDIFVGVGSRVDSEMDDNGVTVTDDTSTFTSGAIAGAGGGNLSIAGAAAINIVHFDANAQIKENASISTTGNINVISESGTEHKVMSEGIAGGVASMEEEEEEIDEFDSLEKFQIRTGSSDTDAGTVISDARTSQPTPPDNNSQGESEGKSFGLGAAFSINVINENTIARVDQDTVINANGDLVINANSSTSTSLISSAGAGQEAEDGEEESEPSTYSLDAAVALNILIKNTVASMNSSPNTSNSVLVGGDLSISSNSETNNTSSADGEAVGESVAVGASVVVSVITVKSNAYLGRNSIVGGLIEVDANSIGKDLVTAQATAKGLSLNKYTKVFKKSSEASESVKKDEILEGDFGDESTPHSVQALSDFAAETQSITESGDKNSSQSKSISVAASVGVNAIDYDVNASIDDGLSISAGNNITVNAFNENNYSSQGTGYAVESDNAIAIGVAISNSLNDTVAKIGNNTIISGANDISIKAKSTQNQHSDFEDQLTAEAIAGASAEKYGVAGALALVNNVNNTEAILGDGSNISNANSLLVSSSDKSRIRTKAWGATAALNDDGDAKLAIGASFSVINTVNETESVIGDNSSISVSGDIIVESINEKQSEDPLNFDGDFDSINPLSILQTTNYYTESIAGAGNKGDNALAGSFSVTVTHNNIYATVGENVNIQSNQLDINAKNLTNARSITGGAAIAQKLGGAGALSGIVLRNKIKSSIHSNSTINTSSDISIAASAVEDIYNIAVAGAASTRENALAGAVGINVFDNRVTSEVKDNSFLSTSNGNINIESDSKTGVKSFIGQGSYGEKTGAGGVLALNLFLNETKSIVHGNTTLNSANELNIKANSFEDILHAALGASGGGQNALAGTLGLNTVKSVTIAETMANSLLNSGNDSDGIAQSILIYADSETNIIELIGAAGVSRERGIGASLDTNVIWKNVLARINGSANADTDIKVISNSDQDITSTVVGFGGGNNLAVGGAVSLGIIKSTVDAIIGGNANINSQGNVQLYAEDNTDFVQLTGSAAISGKDAVGGALGVSVFIGQTRAKIEDGAFVTALGNAVAIDVPTGETTYTSQLLNDLSNADVSNIRELFESGLSSKTINEIKDSILGEVKVKSSMRGLSVIAFSDQDVVNIVASGSGASGTGIAANVATAVFAHTAEASIGNATINANNTSANVDQQVLLHSIIDSNVINFSGALTVSGGDGVGGAGEIFTAVKNISAYIGAGANVQSKSDVTVAANSNNRLLSVAAGFVGGGGNTIGGTLAAGVIVNNTQAYIDGNVNTEGNIDVSADDNSFLAQISGVISAGGGTVGFGASFGLSVFNSTTLAYVGSDASINASGEISIEADTNESVYGLAVAGSGGGTVGIAGALAIRVHNSSTRAYAEGNINQDSTYTVSGQSVNIRAHNNVRELGVVGGLSGGGTVGFGFSGDVVVIRNQTNAYIGNGALVNANDDINISAISNKEVDSYSVAFGAGGTAGIAGAVSVMVLGASLGSDERSEISGSDENGNNGNAWSGMDDRTTSSQVGDDLGSTDEALEIKGILDASTGRAAISSIIEDDSSVSLNKTQAFIDTNAQVNSGKDISINARDGVITRLGAGAITGSGTFTVGGSVGIVVVGDSAEAFIASNARVNSSRYLDITASTEENLHTLAVAGGGSLYAAINGSIVNQTVLSNTYAYIGSGAIINDDDNGESDQRVSIQSNSNTKTFSLGGDGGGALVGIGISANITTISKNTKSFIGSRANIKAKREILIDASSIEKLIAITVSAQGGALGLGGVISPQTVVNTTEAYISDGSILYSQGNIRVQAMDDLEIDTVPLAGQFGATTVGGAIGINTVLTTTQAYVGSANVTALGEGGTMDIYNSNITSSAVDMDAKTTTDSDSGESETTTVTQKNNNYETDSIRGLAVVAVSHEDIFNAPIGFAVSGGQTNSATAGVNIVQTQTKARIANGANINTINTNAHSDQKVIVHASDKTEIVGISITGSVSNGSSYTMSSNIDVINKQVLSEIGGNVKSSNTVSVKSESEENLIIGAIDGGISSGTAIGGSIAGSVIVNNVDAKILDNTNIKTSGDLNILATDNASINKTTGRVGISKELAVGASMSIDIIKSNVNAYIGNNVDADSSGIINIDAISVANFDDRVVAGSVAEKFALAGAFSIKVSNSNVKSYIGRGTRINQTESYKTNEQDVKVNANDAVYVNSIAGAGAISGIASAGASINTVIVRNTVESYVAEDTNIYAGRDVDIGATSSRDIEMISIAGAGGLGVGYAGSLVLASVGSELGNDGKEQLGGDNNSVINSLSSQLSSDHISSHSSGEKGDYANSRRRSEKENTSALNNTDGLDNYLNMSSTDSLDKTSAYIGSNSSIIAVGDISIISKDISEMKLTAGGATIGSSAIGGWFAVGISNTTVQAFSNENVTLSSGGSLTISADLEKIDSDKSGVESIGGSAGLLGFAGSLAILKQQSTSLAYTGRDNILFGEQLNVQAGRTADIYASSLGGVSGIFSAGVSISTIEVSGGTQAYLGVGNTVGTQENSFENVTVKTESNMIIDSSSTIGAAGIGSAISGGISKAVDRSINISKINNNSTIQANNNVQILSNINPKILTKTFGVNVSGGSSVGLNTSESILSTTSSVEVGDNVRIDAGNDITLFSLINKPSSDSSASSYVTGATGGISIGLGATDSLAQSNSVVQAKTGANNIFNSGNDIVLEASDLSTVSSEVLGVSVGGLLAIGFNKSKVVLNSSSLVELGRNNTINAINAFGLNARGENRLVSDSTSGAGALGALVASSSDIDSNANTHIRILDGTASSYSNIKSGSVSINVSRKLVFDSKSNSYRASVVGASGSRVNSTIRSNISADMGNYNTIEARSFNVIAKNEAEKNIFTDGNLYGGSGGVWNAAAASSITNITHDTGINIGENSSIKVIGDRTDPGEFNIRAINEGNIKDKGKLEAGGAIAVALAETNINYNASNTINIERFSSLDSVGDVSIGSRTLADISAVTYIKTFGLAGAGSGISNANVSILNNTILDNNSKVRSDGDIFVMAGHDGGLSNNLISDAETRIWNKTVFPISTSPDANSAIEQENEVIINDDAAVLSVGDVILRAENGAHVSHGYGEGKDLYSEALSDIANFLGISDGSALFIRSGRAIDNSNSSVKINGNIRSGIQNSQYVNFGSDFHAYGKSSGNLIHYFVAKNEINGNVEVFDVNSSEDKIFIRNINSSSQSENIKWTFKGNVPLTQEISNEIFRLKKLRAAYDGAPEIKATLDSEISRLETQLGSIEKSTIVQVIELDDIYAQNGDIRLYGDNFTGTGTLYAPGDATISITNDSPSFLRLNKLNITNRTGGRIILNNIRVRDNQSINSRNKEKIEQANFLITDNTNSSDPSISIINNFDVDDSRYNIMNLPDLLNPEVQLRDVISNHGGSVNITNRSGSIVSSSSIFADSITLSTGEDFIQNYISGIYNIGGDPSSQFGTIADQKELESFDNRNTYTNTNRNDAEYMYDGSAALPEAESSIIAGNNVFITAEILNINGRIKSGNPDRSITITNSMINNSNVQNARNLYNQAVQSGNSSPDLQYYTISSSGENVDKFRTRINFKTDQIELIAAGVRGGLVQLTGKIISTGNGIIQAVDGYGRFLINNETNKTISLGRLDLGDDIEGKISIIDTSRTGFNGSSYTKTYSRLGSVLTVKDNTTLDSNGNPNNIISQTNSRTSSYTPKSDQRYYWVNGQNEGSREIITHAVERAKFLFIPFGSTDLGTEISRETISLTSSELINGGYVSTEINSNDYSYQFTREQASRKLRNQITTSKCVAWFIVCVKTRYTTKQEYDEGYRNYYEHNVKASHNISIEFTGYDTGDISVSSQGSIILNSSIRNLKGNTSIESINGDILSGTDLASINGESLSLIAGNGSIGGLGKNIILEQEDFYIFSASAEKDIHINASIGNLNFNQISSENGDVFLKADGLIQSSSTEAIIGNSIKIYSRNSGVGAALNPLSINSDSVTGSVYIEAAGDIHISEFDGDLLVDRIISHGGDINVKSSGLVLDGNTEEQQDVIARSKLLNIYDDLRLTGSNAENSGDESLEIFKSEKKREYKNYWNNRNLQEVRNDIGIVTYTSESYDVNKIIELSNQDKILLKEQNNWNDENIRNYENTLTEKFHESHEYFGSTNYDPNFTYTMNIEDEAMLKEGASWTEKELNSGISAGLLIETSDTQVRIETSNFSGRNVKITAAGQIGSTLNDLIITFSESNSVLLNDDERIALASAERDDLTITSTELRIARKEDIDIDATGTIDLTANGHIFLGSEEDVNIIGASSTEQIRVEVSGSIYSSAPLNTPIFNGVNLILEAGNGSIGTQANPILIEQDANNKITARARNNIYIIENSGDMRVDTLFSENSIYLTADGSILDYYEDEDLDIRSKDLYLNAGGEIGGSNGNNEALDIGLNANGNLTAIASSGGVYLYSPSRILNIQSITATDDIILDSMAGISVQGIISTDEIINLKSINGDINFSSLGKLINSSSNITLSAGSAGESEKYSIIMEDGSTIVSSTGLLDIRATGDIQIGSISTSADEENAFNLNAGGEIIDGGDSDIDISLMGDNALAYISGDEGIGNMNGLETHINQIKIRSVNGDVNINNDSSLNISEIVLKGSSRISSQGDINILSAGVGVSATGDSLELEARDGGNLEIGESIYAPNADIRLISEGYFNQLAGNTIYGKNITIIAQDYIDLESLITINRGNIVVHSLNSYIANGNLLYGENISLRAYTYLSGSNINFDANSISLQVDNGDIGYSNNYYEIVTDASFSNISSNNLYLRKLDGDLEVGRLSAENEVILDIRNGSVGIGTMIAEKADIDSVGYISIGSASIKESLNLDANDIHINNLSQKNSNETFTINSTGNNGSVGNSLKIKNANINSKLEFTQLRASIAEISVSSQYFRIIDGYISHYIDLVAGRATMYMNNQDTSLRDRFIQLYAPEYQFRFDLNQTSFSTDAFILYYNQTGLRINTHFIGKNDNVVEVGQRILVDAEGLQGYTETPEILSSSIEEGSLLSYTNRNRDNRKKDFSFTPWDSEDFNGINRSIASDDDENKSLSDKILADDSFNSIVFDGGLSDIIDIENTIFNDDEN